MSGYGKSFVSLESRHRGSLASVIPGVGGSRKNEARWQLFVVGSSALNSLRCFDTVDWVTGRESGLWKTCTTYPQRFFSRAAGEENEDGSWLTQVYLDADNWISCVCVCVCACVASVPAMVWCTVDCDRKDCLASPSKCSSEAIHGWSAWTIFPTFRYFASSVRPSEKLRGFAFCRNSKSSGLSSAIWR